MPTDNDECIFLLVERARVQVAEDASTGNERFHKYADLVRPLNVSLDCPARAYLTYHVGNDGEKHGRNQDGLGLEVVDLRKDASKGR